MKRLTWKKLSVVALVIGGLSVFAEDALAIVGRPATPVSVAGVARRTVRRTAY